MLIPHCSHTLKALLLDIGVTVSLVGLRRCQWQKKKKRTLFIYVCLSEQYLIHPHSFFKQKEAFYEPYITPTLKVTQH